MTLPSRITVHPAHPVTLGKESSGFPREFNSFTQISTNSLDFSCKLHQLKCHFYAFSYWAISLLLAKAFPPILGPELMKVLK